MLLLLLLAVEGVKCGKGDVRSQQVKRYLPIDQEPAAVPGPSLNGHATYKAQRAVIAPDAVETSIST